MSKTIEPSSSCPDCGGYSPYTQDYKDIPIFECEDCGNRFGFLKEEKEILREVA